MSSVTKQYNLVPVTGQPCRVAGKVSIDLMLHWPCITVLSGLTTLQAQGLSKIVREMSTSPTLLMG